MAQKLGAAAPTNLSHRTGSSAAGGGAWCSSSACRPIVWREAPGDVTKVMIRKSVSVRGGAYYVAYTARRDSRGGEVTAERRDGYESLDHSLAQSHRGALGLEARATSVTFSVDRLRHFLDLEQGCVVAGAPLVVHMKALCSCTPLTVSSPPTAF